MTKFNIVLTEEQFLITKALLGLACKPLNSALHQSILTVLADAEPIQEKVWLPFTALKDGGTYLTRDRKLEVIVHLRDRYWKLDYPFEAAILNTTYVWTSEGCYDLCEGICDLDLTLELQLYEEKTGE